MPMGRFATALIVMLTAYANTLLRSLADRWALRCCTVGPIGCNRAVTLIYAVTVTLIAVFNVPYN